MDAIQRRKDLAQAISSHDISRVKAFLHPKFVVRGADSMAVMDYAALLNRLPDFFKIHPEYKQTVEIESSIVTGDTATLTTRRIEVLHILWWPHTISSRWTETWKKAGDEWVLAEEKPASA
jgi:hypothetical protein